MKQTLLLTIIMALGVVTCAAQSNDGGEKQKPDQSDVKSAELSTLTNGDHTEWISKSLQKIEEIKVGMTRADLLKVFEEGGGLSTSSRRTYVFRECFYIKVDVEFKAAGEAAKDRNGVAKTDKEHNEDIITKISKPYLDRVVID